VQAIITLLNELNFLGAASLNVLSTSWWHWAIDFVHILWRRHWHRLGRQLTQFHRL